MCICRLCFDKVICLNRQKLQTFLCLSCYAKLFAYKVIRIRYSNKENDLSFNKIQSLKKGCNQNKQTNRYKKVKTDSLSKLFPC